MSPFLALMAHATKSLAALYLTHTHAYAKGIKIPFLYPAASQMYIMSLLGNLAGICNGASECLHLILVLNHARITKFELDVSMDHDKRGCFFVVYIFRLLGG